MKLSDIKKVFSLKRDQTTGKNLPVEANGDTEWTIPTTLLSRPIIGKSNKKQIIDYSITIKEVIEKISCKVTLESSSEAPRFLQFLYKPTDGGKVADKAKLERAIAQKLDIESVIIITSPKLNSRIEVQIGRKVATTIMLREALESKEFKASGLPLSFPVGKDAQGKMHIVDLRKIAHVMAGGQTGSGKSNFTGGVLIPSLLSKNSPEDLKLILIDPKQVEFGVYEDVPHMLRPVLKTPDEIKDAIQWLESEMDNRFKILADNGVSNIEELNSDTDLHLPFIITIIDEVADLMMLDGQYYEKAFVRLLQMSRAVGIHLYIGTSRPSEDVLPGLMRANFPARIAFTTASRVDSETLIDMPGAERLLGKGDLLFSTYDSYGPIRLQAPFAFEKDIEALINYISTIY